MGQMERNRIFVVPVCLFLIMVWTNTLLAEQANKGKLQKADVIQRTKKLQMPFITNEGQTNERVMFYASTFGGTVFVTKDGEIVYALPHRKNAGESDDVHHYSPRPDSSEQTDPLHKRKQGTAEAKHEKGGKGVVLKEEIIGGSIDTIKGEKKDISTVNDFRGNDPSKWKTNIPTYEIVTLGEVYKGIELKLKAYGNNVEKLFYVKPGADPGVIRLKLSGVQALRVNEEGQLEAETALGTVKFTKPIVYQESKVPSPSTKESISSAPLAGKDEGGPGHRQYIESTYVVIGNEYSFKLGDYDRTRGVVIDPLLTSTCLGGSGGFGYDFGNTLKTDINGYIYIAGNTWSSNFPTSIGAYDNFINYSSSEAFVSKFSGDLATLLASTYLGGSDWDSLSSLAIDGNGNIFVVGETRSLDFPTTNEAYDSSYNGGGYYDDKGEYYEEGDAFVSKLDGNLTSLLASTYLGGSASDGAFSIGINSDGNIYVAGWTSSSDFPTTPGAYDTSFGGYSNAFLSKLNGDLTSLLASTYLGSGYEEGNSIAIDAGGNIYVTGLTLSSDFPTTTGAYDTSFNSSGSTDAFVSKFSADLTDLLASTYLGGLGDDSGNSIAIGPDGNIYVAGTTRSSDFPTSSGVYDTNYNGGNYDAFVSKFSADLTDLPASTYLGGLGDDSGNSIAIGPDGNIYVAGTTGSSDFPTSSGVYDTNYNGGNYDAFVSKFSADLTDLPASTYLGGLGDDSGNSIAIGPDGNIYVAGYTESLDFPTTPSAYDSSYNGATDVFVSRFNSDLSNILSSTYLGGSTGYDTGNSIAIDKSGHIYVTGWTTSSDFPTTTGAYDASYNGGGYDYDVIISRLNTDLTDLLASTYLGGLGDDTGNSITIDSDGNIYVAGYTNSSDFPTTPGAYDTSYNNGSAFVSKLSGDLTDLLASTYLGGSSSYSSGNSMVTDSNGNIYVANVSSILKLDETLTNLLASTTLNGGTIGAMAISLSGNIYVTGIAGSNFQTTPGAYDTSFNGSGSTDAFVSKLSADLKDLLASTYLGGLSSDSGNSIATGFDGSIYVTGETFSSDFPTTPGAYDDSLNYSDAFISKLSEDLTSLLASTYLGGAEGSSSGNSIAIDSAGGIFVTGWTQSSNFPTTIDAYDTSYGGGGVNDVFVSKLNGDLKNLLASTYLGGSGEEFGNSIAINYNGNVYVVGTTYSPDFPISADAYDTFNNEIYHGDIFISQFDSNLSAQVTPTPTPTPSPVVTPTPNPEIIPAEVDIKPGTINLKSKGCFKAFIKLPSPYAVNKIVTDTIGCEGAEAINGKVGKDRFIATFKRQDLDSDSDEELTVSGELEDGTKFEGSDIVKMIKQIRIYHGKSKTLMGRRPRE
ncbi:MAG: hypothetical protein E3K36_04440 [Candidatus Brocadia sp.]|nr:hypothetical protein [Candidatus Brocadia sp.]